MARRKARVRDEVKIVVPRAEPKRDDQTRCPKCGHWGCPCSNGSKQRTDGKYFYRVCALCEWGFVTRILHGQSLEEIVA